MILANCPVVVTVNLELESRDARLAGAAGLFGRHSYGRYGAREGVWRLLETFRSEAVKATFFADAADTMRHRPLLEAILQDGHEVAVLGVVLAEAGSERLEALAEARDVLAVATGAAPLGWRAADGLVGPATLPELARLGFAYDSSFQDDDQPYVLADDSGRTLVELPVFEYLTDATFYGNLHSSERVRTVWREELAAMYAARSYIHLTLNARGDIGSARAVRAQVVADFIAQAARLPGAAFYRCDQLAKAWSAATTVTEPFPI